MAVTAATMIANYRIEVGPLFDSLYTIPDARIVDYLNEGQDWMSQDVTKKVKADVTWAANAETLVLPTDYVRLIRIDPDPNFTGDQVVPPYIEVDGALVFTDPTPRAAGAVYLYYEAMYASFLLAGSTDLPRPGPEALVAFAVWRAMMRFVNDRDVYARYATQVGTNAIDPADIERNAQSWYQRYLEAVDVLKLRKTKAVAAPVASWS